MAIIGIIRNRLGLVTSIIIGLALLSFILSDLFSSKYSLTGGPETNIATLAGEDISYKEFDEKFQANLENYRNRARNGQQLDEDKMREDTWQEMLHEKIMQKEYDALGISFSTADFSQEELLDMTVGNNVHQAIESNFTDPKTNVFNKDAVKRFLEKFDEMEADQQNAWLELEEYMMKDRANQKYNTLITKGLYVTQAEAKRDHVDKQKEIKFEYVLKRYVDIPDSTIEVTENEIKDYYEKNKDQNYKKDEPSRKLEYVVFEIIPSAQDSDHVKDRINKLLAEFQQTKEDSLFVSLNSETSFNDVFQSQGNLPQLLDSTLFNAAIGSTFGPYIEDGAYKIAKLIARETRPDSVQARHILIRPVNGDYKVAQTRIDSIKKAIEGGAPFQLMAMKFSEDGSKEKGGDLGTFSEGQMVKPFNDACFTGKSGQLMVVTTQFGVHLIEVMKSTSPKTKVKIGVIENNIEPSSATRNEAYNKASKFVSENNSKESFEKAIAEQGLNKRVADNVKKGDRSVIGLEASRELVRWAWTADVDDVTPTPFEFDNKIVVARLSAAHDDGYILLDEVKEEIEVAVKKDKKAEKIMADLTADATTAGSLQALAGKLNTQVDTLDHIKFIARGLPGLGRELDLIGTVFALPAGKMSAPIKGEQGVYVVYVESVSEVTPPQDYKMNKDFLSNNIQRRAGNEVYKALEKNANIEDNRAAFY